jgi:hypothetical protein
MKRQFRQGDVLIEERVASRDMDQTKPVEAINGRLILAYGEATGHTHSVSAEDAVMVIAADGTLLLDVMVETPLLHQEHDVITLPVGHYRVVRQRVYTPEKFRIVSD